VRNDDGVIVGVRTRQEGPTVLGHIQLPPRRRVVVTPEPARSEGGRASARKEREKKATRRPPRKIPRRVTGERVSHTVEMSEEKRRVRVDETVTVSSLAHQMSQKATTVLRVLWKMGMRKVTVNSTLDVETAELVASEFDYTIENVAFREDAIIGSSGAEEGSPRPPVVTVMGHVDHGKTTLLDHIRQARVAEGEAGGITQHIGAYTVATPHGDIVFLDTPGHAAFSAMRTRGAHVTDVVVLVVAADDGVMPTTVEAIEHAQAAGTPVIVAINKMDRPDANPGRVKQMLMRHGLIGEEFGGGTTICEVSAVTGDGVAELLEVLALQAEVMDLRAVETGRASGTMLEARVDRGRGVVATVLVREGTLRKGDILVAGEFSGRVRALRSDAGRRVEEAPPGTPVEVFGLDGAPVPGDAFDVVEDERDAKQLVAHRRDRRRKRESARSVPMGLDRISRTPTLKVVLRADTQGSVEALREMIEGLSTEKVRAEVIFAGVGAVSENDVKFASAGGGIIVGFNVKPTGGAGAKGDEVGVPVQLFDVLYRVADDLRERMIDLLQPVLRERELGRARVRALFPIPKIGVVAGCRVVQGKVTRHSQVRVLRGTQVVFSGAVRSLRKVKEDVAEVGEGHECGLVVDSFSDVRPDDLIEAFEIERLRPSL
jgi:translation initiation factor IF-2